MKSVEYCRPARSLARYRSWFDDDEPTGEIRTLGSLVSSAITVVDETASIDDIRQLLCELRVPAITVVDDDRSVRGIVTRTDILRAVDTGGATAAEVMSRFVFALPAETPVERAAALMAFEAVGQIIVTGDAGELVGMVSALDIARYLAVREGYLAD